MLRFWQQGSRRRAICPRPYGTGLAGMHIPAVLNSSAVIVPALTGRGYEGRVMGTRVVGAREGLPLLAEAYRAIGDGEPSAELLDAAMLLNGEVTPPTSSSSLS